MDNNQDDIKNSVNRFKKYITFIIINSAINYSKKIKLRRKREVQLEEQIIDNMCYLDNIEDESNCDEAVRIHVRAAAQNFRYPSGFASG